jgi:hypothetical protein
LVSELRGSVVIGSVLQIRDPRVLATLLYAKKTFKVITTYPEQGCQIFLGTTYQNWGKYTK